MERFTIRADLVTPAIISTLTLDRFLGAILFDDLQDVDRARAAIPLQCQNGLFHASMSLLAGATEVGTHCLIAGRRATQDLDLELIKLGMDGGPHRHLGPTGPTLAQ